MPASDTKTHYRLLLNGLQVTRWGLFFCVVVVFFFFFLSSLLSARLHSTAFFSCIQHLCCQREKTALSSVTSPTAGAIALRVWSCVPSLIYHPAYGASCQGGTQFHNSHSRSGLTSQLAMHSSEGWGLECFYFFLSPSPHYAQWHHAHRRLVDMRWITCGHHELPLVSVSLCLPLLVRIALLCPMLSSECH